MPEFYDVLVKVVDQKGECGVGHKVGDEFIIKDMKTPEGLCVGALDAMCPMARFIA